jgi:hypothetical protein
VGSKKIKKTTKTVAMWSRYFNFCIIGRIWQQN